MENVHPSKGLIKHNRLQPNSIRPINHWKLRASSIKTLMFV
jgi:hypothetical protein